MRKTPQASVFLGSIRHFWQSDVILVVEYLCLRFSEAMAKGSGFCPSLAGPGNYNPHPVEGFKADPKSPFLGKQRFNELQKEGDLQNPWVVHRLAPVFEDTKLTRLQCAGPTPDRSPPRNRARPLGANAEGRQYSWATKRISELQQDLDCSQRLIKVALRHGADCLGGLQILSL